MGWAHPWFIPDQGGVGGEGIATFEGHYVAQGASREGVVLLALQHRMNVCRQPRSRIRRPRRDRRSRAGSMRKARSRSTSA